MPRQYLSQYLCPPVCNANTGSNYLEGDAGSLSSPYRIKALTPQKPISGRVHANRMKEKYVTFQIRLFDDYKFIMSSIVSTQQRLSRKVFISKQKYFSVRSPF
jgi:hypothetical protein